MTLEDLDLAPVLSQSSTDSEHGDLLPKFDLLQSLLIADAKSTEPPTDLVERTLARISSQNLQA